MTKTHFPEISVTGMGVVSALGVGVPANLDGLRRGDPTGLPDPMLDGLPINFSCSVPDFDAAAVLESRLVERIDPFIQMALIAAREAVTDAGLDPEEWDSARVAVVVGVATGSMLHYTEHAGRMLDGHPNRVSSKALPRSLPNLAAGEIAMDLRTTGPNLSVSTACASGATAIGVGRDLLRAGTCDIAIVGGAESGRSRFATTLFAQMGALSRRCDDPARASRPFDAGRDGFVMGEGAGILVLERDSDAMARGATRRGRLLGYGASADAYHFAAPDPEGRGVELAIRSSLTDAGLGADDIGHINAHGTSTPRGDAAEALVLGRMFPANPPVTATKSLTGHAFGGAGGIEAVFTLLSLQHGFSPAIANLDIVDEVACGLDLVRHGARKLSATVALSNSFGFGGQNAALVLAA